VKHYYPHLTERSSLYFQFLIRNACCSEMIVSVQKVCRRGMIRSQSVLNSQVYQNCCGLKLSCGRFICSSPVSTGISYVTFLRRIIFPIVEVVSWTENYFEFFVVWNNRRKIFLQLNEFSLRTVCHSPGFIVSYLKLLIIYFLTAIKNNTLYVLQLRKSYCKCIKLTEQMCVKTVAILKENRRFPYIVTLLVYQNALEIDMANMSSVFFCIYKTRR
jgi:hypothetical protein